MSNGDIFFKNRIEDMPNLNLIFRYSDAAMPSVSRDARAELAQLRANLQAAQERIADQARQLEEARDTMIAVKPHLPISGDGYNTLHSSRVAIDDWLAANPAPSAEQRP